MHNAPLVKYPLGRFAWGRWRMVLIGGVAAGLTGCLFYGGQLSSIRALFPLGLSVLLLMLWARSLGHPLESAWLVWDGENWQWWQDEEGQGAYHFCTLSVQADFQQTLLLQLRLGGEGTAQTSKWVWLYKGFAPAKWHALRCAVYSRLY
jgi:hypothetical protein